MNETADQRAERLLQVGLDIAARVRDEAPADIAARLRLDAGELLDLVFVLAACVDTDAPVWRLLSWRDTTPAPVVTAPIDHKAVARFLRGEHVELGRQERVEVVRQLAAFELTDREIGERLGVSQGTVAKLRSRHGIAAGVPVGGRRPAA